MASRNSVVRKPKSNAAELNGLRTRYKNLRKGYRHSVYEIMSEIMGMVLDIRNNPENRKKLRKQIGSPDDDTLTSSVVRYVMGGGNGTNKLADKRARVINYLYDNMGIEPADFVATIKKSGGIEKLARQAAQANKGDSSHIKPDNDNKPPAIKFQLQPQHGEKIEGLKDGRMVKIIATKKAGKLIVAQVIKLTSRSAA